MDRGCGSILELWDVARYLKLNSTVLLLSASYWMSLLLSRVYRTIRVL
ncbi:hypothetical protein Gotur_015454 [Gossypium turneri]